MHLNRLLQLAGISLFVMALSHANSALALTISSLPYATGYTDIYSDVSGHSYELAPSSRNIDLHGGSASAEVDFYQPSVYASSFISYGSSLKYVGSAAFLHYSMEILGPQNIYLPIDVQYLIRAFGGGDTFPAASISVSSLGSNFDFGSFGGFDNQPIIGKLSLPSNTIIDVVMQAEAGASNPGWSGFVVGQGAAAEASSYFFLDPSYDNSGGYRIEVSSGIGNSPIILPTPLPSSLPLFLTGLFTLVWFVARAERKNGQNSFSD